MIDIVVLTFDMVEPNIAETTISKAKNFDIGTVAYNLNIVEITTRISKDKTSISIYQDIEVPTISKSILATNMDGLATRHCRLYAGPGALDTNSSYSARNSL
jgi:hypothetical protein